ncbi:MAG: dTDP-4-dehydrorhamnose reductase [Candidatus Acidiferrales bacterium]
MSVKILLIGKNGQIGTELAALLPRLGQLVALDRQQLDLCKPNQIRASIGEVRPQIIVNAAAYTAVDKAETDEATARSINADAPAVIAEKAKNIGAALVHYSTDYVFDGSKNSPYDERYPPNPLSVYGKTKLAGEQAIRDSGVPHLIFRTAWVYATRGRNFVLTILRLASQREELRIVRDQIGAPTWCREIARATTSILGQFSELSEITRSFSQASGTYHMTAGGVASWYDFAQAILDEADKAPPNLPWLAAAMNGHPLLAHRVVPITTVEYPTPARRPPYSVLSNALLTSTFRIQLPDWREQLHSAFSTL